MSELQAAIDRLRDHVIARKPHATTLYDLGDGRNLHDDCQMVVEQAERTVAICGGYAIQQERLAAAEALLCHTADGQFYGCGSKVFYRDPTGYIQGLDVGVMFRTDSSVPEIVYHPYPVYSSHNEAAKGGE